MKKKLLSLAVGTMLFVPTLSSAVGLGSVRTYSHLNEKLSAEIPVLSVKRKGKMSVSLASNEEFARRDVRRTKAVNDLRFALTERGGRLYIKVSSKRQIVKPYLNFILRLSTPEGVVSREYAIFLDPAGTKKKFVNNRREVARPYRAAKNTATRSKVSRSPASSAGSRRYGPVKKGETLWSIAERTRPSARVSVRAMVRAIKRANRRALAHGLLAGSYIRIPAVGGQRYKGGHAPARAHKSTKRPATSSVKKPNRSQYNPPKVTPARATAKPDVTKPKDAVRPTVSEIADSLDIGKPVTKDSPSQPTTPSVSDQVPAMKPVTETAKASVPALPNDQANAGKGAPSKNEDNSLLATDNEVLADDILLPELDTSETLPMPVGTNETGGAKEETDKMPLSPTKEQPIAETTTAAVGDHSTGDTPADTAQTVVAEQPVKTENAGLEAPVAPDTATPPKISEPATPTPSAPPKKVVKKSTPTPAEPTLMEKVTSTLTDNAPLIGGGAGGLLAIGGGIWYFLRRRKKQEEMPVLTEESMPILLGEEDELDEEALLDGGGLDDLDDLDGLGGLDNLETLDEFDNEFDDELEASLTPTDDESSDLGAFEPQDTGLDEFIEIDDDASATGFDGSEEDEWHSSDADETPTEDTEFVADEGLAFDFNDDDNGDETLNFEHDDTVDAIDDVDFSADDDLLDFDFDDDGSDSATEVSETEVDDATNDGFDDLDFSFDALKESLSESEEIESQPVSDNEAVDEDLGMAFTLTDDDSLLSSQPEEATGAESDDLSDLSEFSFDDLSMDLLDEADDDASATETDAPVTESSDTANISSEVFSSMQMKLDLANSFLSIGQNERAKALLKEVTTKGNAEQVAHAEELLSRI